MVNKNFTIKEPPSRVRNEKIKGFSLKVLALSGKVLGMGYSEDRAELLWVLLVAVVLLWVSQ